MSSRHAGDALVLNTLPKVKDWKDKFFFVSGQKWEFEQGKTKEMRLAAVLRKWSRPSVEGNFIIIYAYVPFTTF